MFCHRPPLTLITALLIVILFVTKQMKDLYEKNQKHHRMENYNIFIGEVSSSMSALESSANKSSVTLHHLMNVLQQHHHRRPRARRTRPHTYFQSADPDSISI